jgi:hypothetical protein
MTDCPLVLIRWLDSRQPSGQWRYLADLPEARPVEVASVGWLVRDTADVKVVCQNVGDLDNPDKAQASGIMTIPARCVLSIERLVEADDASAAADLAGLPDLAVSADLSRSAGSVETRRIATAQTPPAP